MAVADQRALPGDAAAVSARGYDASAAALSFVAQVASLLSVLLVPVIIVVGVLSFGGD